MICIRAFSIQLKLSPKALKYTFSYCLWERGADPPHCSARVIHCPPPLFLPPFTRTQCRHVALEQPRVKGLYRSRKKPHHHLQGFHDILQYASQQFHPRIVSRKSNPKINQSNGESEDTRAQWNKSWSCPWKREPIPPGWSHKPSIDPVVPIPFPCAATAVLVVAEPTETCGFCPMLGGTIRNDGNRTPRHHFAEA